MKNGHELFQNRMQSNRSKNHIEEMTSAYTLVAFIFLHYCENAFSLYDIFDAFERVCVLGCLGAYTLV